LFFQDNISFLKSVSLSFFSRFFPYFLYFGILPRYFSAKGSLKTNKTFNTAQDSLEARPYYWDQSNVPEDTFTIERPLDVKIISKKNIIQSNTKTSDEIYQITMDHGGKFKFWEGQSVGIINPSDTIPTENYMDKNNTISDIKYNIASSRYGDEKRGRTLSIICPRRSNSNDFLYDSKPGEYIKITGPHFKTNIFPETDPKMDYILIATDTGIAPFRSFLTRLFVENTRIKHAYQGHVYLFYQSENKNSILYENDLNDILSNCPDQFQLYQTFQNETTITLKNFEKATNEAILKSIKDHIETVFLSLSKGGHLFFSVEEEKNKEIITMTFFKMMKHYVQVEKGLDYSK